MKGFWLETVFEKVKELIGFPVRPEDGKKFEAEIEEFTTIFVDGNGVFCIAK